MLSTVTDGSGQVVIDGSGNPIFSLTVNAGNNAEATFRFDSNGSSVDAPSGAQTLYNAIGQTGGTLIDALSIIKAIQTGNPIPIVASGLRLANDLSSLNGKVDLNLSGAANAATGVLSLLDLENALQRGDALAAVSAGAQALSFGAQAYLRLVGGTPELQTLVDTLSGQSLTDELGNAIGQESGVIPYLNIANSLAQGDAVGAAVAALAFNPTTAPIAAAYEVFSFIDDLFGDDDSPPPPWGSGHFVWAPDGTVGFTVAGENGGDQTVAGVLGSVEQSLNRLVAQAQLASPRERIGLIANRLPGLAFQGQVFVGGDFTLSDLDPVSGADRSRHFDASGAPTDAAVGSPDYFRNLGEQFVRSALAREAIAPQWEVDSAREQAQAGDPQAGLTEEERAGRAGELAAPLDPKATSEVFRPVVLDLNGDGIQTTGAAKPVAFDVDDSGFLKNTAWIGRDDGFLVLDRNANGFIDSGRELFSNGRVAEAAKGLASLAWVDANADGALTAADPVFGELRVWQDANGNGVIDAGEVKTLGELGIASLNYGRGSYALADGTVRELASPELQADAQGTRTQVVPQGILIESSNGQVSLVATQVEDLSNLKPGEDRIQGVENVELDILAGDLLANDRIGNSPHSTLALAGVDNARHGAVSLENGVVHFTPEANYFGEDAGFTYTVQDANGNSALASVDISFAQVNDTPVISSPGNYPTTILGYDYTPLFPGDSAPNGGPVPLVLTPFFQPGYGYDQFGRNFAYRDQPLDDPYNGKLPVIDVDDPLDTLSFSLANAPRHGQATVNADGSWSFTPTDDIGGTDAFVLQVTDPHGATAQQLITVPLPEPAVGGDFGTGNGGGGAPIVLDLDRDGVQLTAADTSQAFFDINGDGWRHRTGWIAPGDGLLAFDANGDGQIAGRNEIAFKDYAPGAQTDLEGLAAFDTNHDGVLNSLDQLWNKFRVWRDADGDGVAQPGEVETLDQAGITSISLASDGQFSTQNGNTIHGIAKVTMADGSQIDAADVSLAVSNQVLVKNADGTTSVVTRQPFAAPGEIDGTDGNDLILGTTGNVVIKSGEGNDVVFSGDGNDVIQVGNGKDVVYAGNGDDLVMAGNGNDVIFTGHGNDLILAGGGSNAIIAGGGNNVIFVGGGNNLIYGGTGNNVIRAGDGDNTIVAGSGSDAIFVGNGNNVVEGGAGVTRIQVGDGNDTLVAGAGVATLIGGAGSDTFVVNNAADVVIAQAGATNAVRSSIDYVLPENVQKLTLTGSDDLTGTGNDLDNVIIGNAGNDTLIAGTGNDTLIAGSGVDTLIGGTGNDTFVVNNVDDVVQAQAGGINTIRTSVSYTASANVQNLTGTGNADLALTGNDLNNVITANSGNDTLIAGSGIDTLVGGTGNDTFVVNNTADVVIAQAGGVNAIQTSVSYTASANVQNLTGTGDADIVLTGNDLNDVITANGGNDTLIAGTGVATMIGGAGSDTFAVNNAGDVVVAQTSGINTILTSVDYVAPANVQNITGIGSAGLILTGNNLDNVITANDAGDTLIAGSGVATLIGGAGNDTFVVDNPGDLVIEQPNAGIDTILSSVSYVLPANVENLTLTGAANLTATGNDLANVLTANSGNDTLIAGTGVATLIGGAGNDTVVVNNIDDVVQAQPGGVNTLQTSVSYTASANVQNLTGTGNADLTLTGNDLNNVITANSGNDTLIAGSGIDTLIGGAGNDTFVVNNVADVVQAQAGSINTILSSVNYVLPANVQNLTGTGSGDLTLTGNNLNDVITANSGNDTLIAGSGIATMIGGTGNDTFVVNNVDDVVQAQSGGMNTIQTSVSYTASANVQNLTGNGVADLTLTGNNLNGVIIANSGNDTLIAGSGVDTLIGGTGNDTFAVNNVADVVQAQAGSANTIQTSVSYTASANVQNLTGTGSADITLTGNDLNDIITANSGNDTLIAGSGVAILIGGAGSDTFVVNNADDVVQAQAGGINTIQTSVSYTASANMQNLTGTGSADIALTGNDLNDIITANSGNDTLIAGSGVATLIGGTGNDTFVVNNVNDVVQAQAGGINTIQTSVSYTASANVQNLTGTGSGDLTLTGNNLNNVITANSGDDTLIGGGGNDTLVAGTGNDTLIGGAGNDTYVYSQGDGLDTVIDPGGNNTVQLGAGLSLQNAVIRLTTANGSPYPVWIGDDGRWRGETDDDDDGGDDEHNKPRTLNAHLRVLDAHGVEQSNQGLDFTVTMDSAGHFNSPIQRFQFADGSVNSFYDMLVKQDIIDARHTRGAIVTGRNDDIVYAGRNTTSVSLGSGNDTVHASSAGTLVYGGGGNDYMVGGRGNDTFVGGWGIDILQGGEGNDTLSDPYGPGALLGGEGRDTITGGAGSDFIAGGRGNDTLSTGATHNVVALNRDDGWDTILASPGATNTLSLGDGISDSDLKFRKRGNDLVLDAGRRAGVTFQGWYAGTANHNFVTLQMIEAAAWDDDRRAADPLRSPKIEEFDFGKLVAQFDQARAVNPVLDRWSLMNGLLSAHLSGSDSAALGGDLAYYYGTRGTLSGMDVTAAQAALKNPQFGAAAQSIDPWPNVNRGANPIR